MIMNLDWVGRGPTGEKQVLDLMKMVLAGVGATGRAQVSLSPDSLKDRR